MSNPKSNGDPASSRGQAPDENVTTSNSPQGLFATKGSWTVATVVAVVMVVLALLGVALTTTNPTFAYSYWLSLAPVYGLLCIVTAWLRSTPSKQMDRGVIMRQVLHWAGVTIAVGLDFFIFRSKGETGEAAGINAMLILALGCFLAGIHFEWLFILVSVLLSLTMVIMVMANEYMWLIFVVGGVTIAVIVMLRRFFRSDPIGSAKATPSPTAGA